MFHFSTRLIFCVGFITGTLLSLFLGHGRNSLKSDKELSYDNWFKNKQYTRKHVSFDSLRYDQTKYTLESDLLFKSVSILCLILVLKDANFKASVNTWGKGCNGIQSINLSKKPKPLISNQSRFDTSWNKICETLKNVPEIYDWVLVINDDTFVITENLRFFLAYRNSSDNFYLGYAVKFWNVLYNLGKAGYVLSRGVIKSMQKSTCSGRLPYMNKEDFGLGYHLATLNISVQDTRDEEVYETKCCSKHTITFNAIEGDKMYTYYYLLYNLQLFHHGHLANRPAIKPPDDEIWQNFLKEQNLPYNISSAKYYEAWENLIDNPNSFARNMRREDYPDDT
ncbi:hypothetical protein HHI36_007224 [Cryptolaemus montrouzieri]|uniref:Glycoprotein-N-acetylgalactosamine 3-beta-galactosyltransferase 1-like n=1 Tax=Cryptolaemus montrouzieri TaxID=559131 RepID=A0ABD2MP16_9CUCU